MNFPSEALQLPAIWFYVFAALVIVAALAVVLARNIVHCAMYLAVTFIAVAGIYVMLESDFLAMVQILIYVGAVTVLILFAIMLSRKYTGADFQARNRQSIPAMLVIIIFLVVIGRVIACTWGGFKAGQTSAWGVSNVKAIGVSLLRDYVLPFEVASVLLLVALVGAIIIARKDNDRDERG